jgi:hypothetical protein
MYGTVTVIITTLLKGSETGYHARLAIAAQRQTVYLILSSSPFYHIHLPFISLDLSCVIYRASWASCIS